MSESYVARMFPGEEPLGRRLQVGPFDLEIVGVVREAQVDNLRWTSMPVAYRVGLREPRAMTALLVRTRLDAASMVAPIRRAIVETQPQTLVSVRTMEDVIDRSIARERLVAGTSAFFGLLGLALAVIGVFGVAANAVAQRTRELGVRIALGARRGDVVRESLRDTAFVAVLGLIAGGLAAIAAARVSAT